MEDVLLAEEVLLGEPVSDTSSLGAAAVEAARDEVWADLDNEADDVKYFLLAGVARGENGPDRRPGRCRPRDLVVQLTAREQLIVLLVRPDRRTLPKYGK